MTLRVRDPVEYLAQHAPGVRDGCPSRFVEVDAVLLPVEKLGAELCLEPLDLSAEGRLRKATCIGGCRHGAMMCECLELSELVDIHECRLAFHA